MYPLLKLKAPGSGIVKSKKYSETGMRGWEFVKGRSLTKVANIALAFITYLIIETHTRVIHSLSGTIASGNTNRESCPWKPHDL